MLGDHAADAGDIGAGDEFQLDAAEAGEPKLQLAVQIDHAGGLHGEGLNLAVGHGSEIHLLAGDALDVDDEDALVGEHNAVTNAFERGSDLLFFNEHAGNAICKLGVVDGLELQVFRVFKVDHGKAFFLIYFPQIAARP